MSRRRSTQTSFSLFSFQDIITSVTGIMILITLMLSLEAVKVASPRTQTVVDDLDVVAKEVAELEIKVAEGRKRAESARTESVENLPAVTRKEVEERASELATAQEVLKAQTAILEARVAASEERLATEMADERERLATLASELAELESESEALERTIEEEDAKMQSTLRGGRIFFAGSSKAKTTWLIELTGGGYRVAPIGRSQKPQAFDSVVALAEWAEGLDPRTEAFLLVVKPSGVGQERRTQTLLAGGEADGSKFDMHLYPIAESAFVLDDEIGAGTP